MAENGRNMKMLPENEFFRMLQRLWYKYYQDLPPLEE